MGVMLKKINRKRKGDIEMPVGIDSLNWHIKAFLLSLEDSKANNNFAKPKLSKKNRKKKK